MGITTSKEKPKIVFACKKELGCSEDILVTSFVKTLQDSECFLAQSSISRSDAPSFDWIASIARYKNSEQRNLPTTSVTRKKSPNVYKSSPKMIDFDTFTKIA